MGVRDALFTFLNEPVSHPGSKARVASYTMKVACWITMVGTILAAGFMFFVAVALMLGSAIAGGILTAFLGQWGWIGAAIGAAIGVLSLAGVVLILGLGALFLWWENTVYKKWDRNEPNGIVWLNVYAIITLVLSINIQFGESTSFDVDFIGATIGVLCLIFGNLANGDGELEARVVPAVH